VSRSKWGQNINTEEDNARAIRWIQHPIKRIVLEPGTVVNTILIMRAGEQSENHSPVEFKFAYYQSPDDKKKLSMVNWKLSQVWDWRWAFRDAETAPGMSEIILRYNPDTSEKWNVADIDFSIMKMKMSEAAFADWACIITGKRHWDNIEKNNGINDPVFAYMAWILRYGRGRANKDGSLAVMVDLEDNTEKGHIRPLERSEIDFVCRHKSIIWEPWILEQVAEMEQADRDARAARVESENTRGNTKQIYSQECQAVMQSPRGNVIRETVPTKEKKYEAA